MAFVVFAQRIAMSSWSGGRGGPHSDPGGHWLWHSWNVAPHFASLWAAIGDSRGEGHRRGVDRRYAAGGTIDVEDVPEAAERRRDRGVAPDAHQAAVAIHQGDRQLARWRGVGRNPVLVAARHELE